MPNLDSAEALLATPLPDGLRVDSGTDGVFLTKPVAVSDEPTLTDLPEASLAPFWRDVQRVTRAVEHALGATGSFVATNSRVSQSVPHLHVHVVPRTKGDGLKGFFWPRKRYPSDEVMADYAAKIARELSPAP